MTRNLSQSVVPILDKNSESLELFSSAFGRMGGMRMERTWLLHDTCISIDFGFKPGKQGPDCRLLNSAQDVATATAKKDIFPFPQYE